MIETTTDSVYVDTRVTRGPCANVNRSLLKEMLTR